MVNLNYIPSSWPSRQLLLRYSRLWHPASLYLVHPWTRTSYMTQASLSSATRSHLLHVVVPKYPKTGHKGEGTHFQHTVLGSNLTLCPLPLRGRVGERGPIQLTVLLDSYPLILGNCSMRCSTSCVHAVVAFSVTAPALLYLLHGPGQPLERCALSPSPCSRPGGRRNPSLCSGHMPCQASFAYKLSAA